MAGVTVTKLGPCGTPPHWHYKVRVGDGCGHDSLEVVRWCDDQFGGPGTGQRWDYFFGEARVVIVLIHSEDDAFAVKMRWA